MKKQGLFLFGLLFTVFVMAAVCNAAGDTRDLRSMQLAANNEYLALYVDVNTTEIAVVDQISGQRWYSNPSNWKDLETQARGTAKDQLGAQVLITYDRPDRRNREVNNYNESIVHGLFEIIPIEDGIRVEYSLGRKWKDEDYLPIFIEQKRMESLIFENISAGDQRNFTNRYHLIYLQEQTELAPLQLQGIDMDALLNGYEFVVVDDRADNYTAQLDELRQELLAAAEADKEKILSSIARIESQLNGYKSQILWDLLDLIYKNKEDLETMNDVKFKHLEQLINTPTYFMGRVPVFARTALIEAVMGTDYTPEQASEDRVNNNLDPLQPNIETFFIPIEYRLEGKSLVVRLPMDELVYPLNVIDNQGDSHTYPLHTITMLPYFGAVYKEQEGYIFMPDGSGALIDFSTKKYTLGYVGTPIYGRDLTEDSRGQQIFLTEQTYLPVYGVKTESGAFLAVIEQGEALARISAAKAGFVNSYNYVGPQFNVMPRSDLSLGPIGSVNVYQKRIYRGDIQIRYLFLVGSSANYAGMAQAYQGYLVNTCKLEKLDSNQELPFYLSVVGSIIKNEPVLGVPREVVRPLTTYEQTEEIVDTLLASGIRNLKLKYNGWLQGGPEHIFPTQVKFEASVGGRDGFINLIEKLKAKSVEFYPEVSFLNVYRNTVFNGFNVRRDAAQFFDNRPKLIRRYNIAFGVPENTDYYILSARSLQRVVNSFFDDYSQYNLEGIALEHMGRQVNADFRNTAETVVDRQQSTEIMQETLAWIKEKNYNILVSGGNAFTYPYVKNIIGAPFSSSNHEIFDETVPFYHLVLHGYINYAGEPLNLADDYRKGLLKAISLGSGLHFQLAYQDTELIVNSDYDHLYSIDYQVWLERAVNDYRLANEILKHVTGKRIVNYARLDSNRFLTEYENGCKITVDYCQYTVTVHHGQNEPVIYQF